MKALWLTLFFVVLAWSSYQPKDNFTWFLEMMPALIGLGLLDAMTALILLNRYHNRQLKKCVS